MVAEGLTSDLGISTIGTRVLSDHMPVSVLREIGETKLKIQEWPLNNFLREASGLEETVRLEINIFYCWNQGSTSVFVLWDVFKAYICGILIAFRSSRLKNRSLVRADLMNMIPKLETLNKQLVLSKTTRQLQKAYSDFKLIDAHVIVQDVLYAKQRAFD